MVPCKATVGCVPVFYSFDAELCHTTQADRHHVRADLHILITSHEQEMGREERSHGA